MNRFILGLAALSGAGVVAAADEPKAGAENAALAKAREAFMGTWEVVAVTPAGATKDARRLVFNPDGTYSALGGDGKELWAGTYEIDPTATPKAWDHRSHDAKKDGTDVLGVYELDGDTLKVACVVGRWKEKEWVGRPRPKAVDPKEADVVIQLRRVKAGR